MFKYKADISHMLGEFKLEGHMFRYSNFVPKLYNYCKSLGFEAGMIMPSRAFCSDENQGYPIIMIAKHFGTFPFNHGQVGGIVATDRHGPHAGHGKDMVIIQASHVGYDPDSKQFGIYRRLCTENHGTTSSCGKVQGVLGWYKSEYQFARNNIYIHKKKNEYYVVIDNQLLDESRSEGLFLNLEKLVKPIDGQYVPFECHSTSKYYYASDQVISMFEWIDDRKNIGKNLLPEFFYYKRNISGDVEGRGHLENNLFNVMPWIVTSESPLLTAAKCNTQVEFDRTFRTIVKEKGYQGKRLIYIAGLHIDISPQEGLIFPLTKFIPWAAYIQMPDGSQQTIEQEDLFKLLDAQPVDNPDQINLEDVIDIMEKEKEVKVL